MISKVSTPYKDQIKTAEISINRLKASSRVVYNFVSFIHAISAEPPNKLNHIRLFSQAYQDRINPHQIQRNL